MTATQQIQDAEQLRQLWAALMPDSELPEAAQFVQWSGIFPHEVVLKGINRASSKRRKMQGTTNPMTLNDCVRYAASVMKHEANDALR